MAVGDMSCEPYRSIVNSLLSTPNCVDNKLELYCRNSDEQVIEFFHRLIAYACTREDKLQILSLIKSFALFSDYASIEQGIPNHKMPTLNDIMNKEFGSSGPGHN